MEKCSRATRRTCAAFLAMLFLLSLFIPVGWSSLSSSIAAAAEDNRYLSSITLQGASSSNLSGHEYVNADRWAVPVASYLSARADGGFERVEWTGESLLAEIFDAAGALQSETAIAGELELFGGYFAGENYRYVLFGAENPQESDSTEVLRIVKYAEDWTRIDACSIYGANTYIPFDAGTPRMVETGGKLYIHTSHEMYADEAGLHHQANMTFVIEEDTMTVADSFYDVMNLRQAGYVSHSFNQYIATDGTYVYRVDHGDAYPRAIALTRCLVNGAVTRVSYTLPFAIQGSIGANDTGVAVGGLALGENTVLIAGNSVDQSSAESYDPFGTRNIFLTVTDKDLIATEIHWLTNYADDDAVSVGNPHLVALSGERFLVLWEETASGNTVLKSVIVNGDGAPLSGMVTSQAPLSDCQPILCSDGAVRWYVTDRSQPTLYTLRPDAVDYVESTHPVTSVPTTADETTDPNTGGQQEGTLYFSSDGNGGLLITSYEGNDLRQIEIPAEVEGFPVTGIGANVFANHTEIEDVILPETIRTIGAGAFAGSGILALTIPASVAEIGDGAFSECEQLSSVVIDDGLTVLPENAFAHCDQLSTVTLPNSLTSIGDYAFTGCSSMPSIDIPDSVSVIGESAFSFCEALYEIDLSDNIRSIGATTFTYTAFYDTPDNWQDGVLYLGNCLLSAEDTLDGDYTVRDGTRTIAALAFSECKNLSAVYLPNSLQYIGESAFSGCTHLTKADIPASVVEIGRSPFVFCSSLNGISVSPDNAYYYTDAYGVLYDKEQTLLLQYPMGLSLAAYTVPDSVDNIGKAAFCGEEQLEQITLPAGLRLVEDMAFFMCLNLDRVVYAGGDALWNGIAFGEHNEPLLTARRVDEAPDPAPDTTAQDTETTSAAPVTTTEPISQSTAPHTTAPDADITLPITSAPPTPSETPGEPDYTLGDVNGDGKVTSADARLALRAALSLEMLNPRQALAADTDKNGIIRSSDARMILRVALKLDTFDAQ